MATSKGPAEMAHDAQKRRALANHGLRPVNATACPRVVAGLRCQDHHLCVCQRHRHLLDHGRIWLDENGRHVLTGEPYDADGTELAEFVAEMAGLGLAVSLSGRSPWNPGSTLLILIRVELAEPADQTRKPANPQKPS